MTVSPPLTHRPTRPSMKIIAAIAAIALLGLTPPASAQATRTWVSELGDDANPGSRTSPCKTFAGAIAKTVERGVVNVLDPGGFGTVTITKSITLDGGGAEGGVLGSATNGIVINAEADDIVILRNLQLDGVGTGLAGITILNAAAVYIENCRIVGFTRGIVETTSAATGTQIFIRDSFIHECSGEGISLAPAEGAASVVFLDRTRIQGCGSGVVVNPRARAILNECVVAFNVADGLKRIGNGVIQSYKNNRLVGNSPDGKATTIAPK